MNVFVVNYSHRYGHDISVYDSEESAGAGIISLAKDYVNEYSDGHGDEEHFFNFLNVKRAIRRGNYEKVIGLWPSLTGDEDFEIIETFVRSK